MKRSALLRNAEFLKLWAGQTISVFGDQVTILALPLAAVLTLDASAFQMGLLTTLGWLPHLLFSLQAGVWLDHRGHRRAAMIAADDSRYGLPKWIMQYGTTIDQMAPAPKVRSARSQKPRKNTSSAKN